MKQVPDILIDASAGCGKTELLALRLLALLFAGAKLESIVGMTFTRAAAAEIYERILTMLARAAGSEEELTRFRTRLCDMAAGKIGDGRESPALRWSPEIAARFAGLTRDDLLNQLKNLIDAMNRVHISTIDSFLGAIVSAYALELGLNGKAGLIDETRSETLRRTILSRLLHRNGADDADFLGACRDAAFGKEMKLFFDGCSELLANAMKLERYADAPEMWGIAGNLPRTAPDLLVSVLEAWSTFYQSQKTGGVCGKPGSASAARAAELDQLLAKLAEAGPDRHFSTAELETLRRFFTAYAEAGNTTSLVAPASFAWIAKLEKSTADAIRILMLHGAKILLSQSARRTTGIGKMLRNYLAEYDAAVTSRGAIQFADLTRLLRRGIARGELTDLAFRMNTRWKHWLLDEFQDTSRDQYEVLNGILADRDDAEESMFLVGDVKQALYGWRAGDSKLMAQAGGEYRLSPGVLKQSFRYGGEICESLNLLFTSPAIAESPLPGEAKKRWLSGFQKHTAAPSTKNGEFAVFQMEPEDKKAPDSPDAATQAARAIGRKILQMKALERGIQCAILVRGKTDGLRLKEILENDPEFAALAPALLWEGDETIAGNPRIQALLSLCVTLQHPGNTFAAEVVKMNRLLHNLDYENNFEFLRGKLEELGFHDFLLEVLRRLTSGAAARGADAAELAAFRAEETLNTLLSAAADFDDTGNRDALAFRDFAAAKKLGERALAGKLRIMTVHHSKGLGFDAVFVPLLEQKRSLSRPDLKSFVVLKDASGGAAGILHAPQPEGMLFSDIRSAVEEQWSDSAFEALCLLYVALTRAKRSVNVYLPAPPKKEGAFFLHSLVRKALANQSAPAEPLQLYYHGDAHWFESCTPPGETSAPPIALPDCTAAPRLKRVRPSEGAVQLVFALPYRGRGAEFGSRLHAFFASIGFLDCGEVPKPAAEFAGHFKSCLADEAAKAALSRHAENSDLWREKAFEIVLDGNWVSGCFDRVEILRDAAGHAVECFLLDYKSNAVSAPAVPAAAAKYERQMQLYCRVLGKLLQLPQEKIHASLLFTACGRVFSFDK